MDHLVNIDRAVEFHRAGKLADAERIYRQLLVRNPNDDAALHLLGVLAGDVGRLDDSAVLIRQAIAINPTRAVYYSNLGETLRRGGKLAEAIATLRCAVQIDPMFPEAKYNLGVSLKEDGQRPAAAEAFQKATQLRPEYAKAFSQLGITFSEMGNYEAAITAIRRAIALKPDVAESYYDLGVVLNNAGHFEQAIAAYKRALEILPNYADPHWNLALIYLLRGDFEHGWSEYEWRWRRLTSLPVPYPGRPVWDGRDMPGQTLLLHTEQGFGDTIQFIRFAPRVARKVGRVILQCQPELVRLFEGFPGIDRIIDVTTTNVPFDAQCLLLSVPHLFRTDLTNIPGDVPYLRIRRRSRTAGPLRVGIAWAGRPTHAEDRKRSLQLNQFAPLAAVEGIQFFSLQKGFGSEQSAAPPPGMDFIDRTQNLHDFADTAALVADLDLIITADTAVAHLAGAMAKPTWVLLPAIPDWRWLLNRSDSPWYPTMRLFRQPVAGDWQTPMREIELALRSRMTDGSGNH